MKIDLPGGLSRDEIAAVRRLARELAADGYNVTKVGLGAGDAPCALVYAGRKADPIRKLVIGARSVLRAVEAIEDIEPEVSAEEYETLQALRTTAWRVAANAKVSCAETGSPTIAEVAHVDFARQARRGADEEGR